MDALIDMDTVPAGTWLTSPQREIDLRALELMEHEAIRAVRVEAEARFRTSPEFAVADAPNTLDAAVRNLLFSSLQIAVNQEPGLPGVVWTVRRPYCLEGQIIPDNRYGSDNPDRVYRLIGVSPDYRYEIRGRRHPLHPSGGELYFEAVRAPGLFGQPLVGLHEDMIDVAADGSFCIEADASPSNGRRNHLHLSTETTNIVLRDTLTQWASQLPNEIEVAVLQGPQRPVRSPTRVVQDAVDIFRQSVDRHLGFLQFCCREQPVNQLLAFERPVHWGVGGGLFATNRFELAEDEALVLTLDLYGSPYFNIAVCDPWATSVDYEHHVSCLNNFQAQPDRDGRYTMVISPQDPGVFNWLDTAGLRTGVVCARWDPRSSTPLTDMDCAPTSTAARAWAPEKAVEPAVPMCRVVTLAELPRVIPEGQARVSTAQRRTMQAERRLEHRVRQSGKVAGQE